MTPKEQRAKLLTEIMEADQKDGLYDTPPSVEKKVTAVEWLVRKLSMELIGEIPLHRWDEISDAVQKAKQMEKEQIIDSYGIGHNDGCAYMTDGKTEFEGSEQYYNETYGKQ